MQFQKEQGNVSSQNDYINMETKAGDVQEAWVVRTVMN